MTPRFSLPSLILLCLALTACEVGPTYTKPEEPVAENWVSEASPHFSIKETVDEKWWNNFNDPILNQLIEKASANNLDLKIAEARIMEARATLSATEGALLPSGDIKGTATREANQVAFPGGPNNPFSSLLRKPFNIFEAGFDASWELDLFGGNRRAEEVAEAEMQASEAQRDDARVSLLAEVARTYVLIRADQAQQITVFEIIKSGEKTVEIEKELFTAGEVPRLNVTQAEAKLEDAKTQLPQITNEMKQAEYSLDVLIGEKPGATHAIIETTAPIPTAHESIILAAPASVIAQRPDIRGAERKLAAATAEQGVAVAKFFPDISISGFFGALNTSASQLVSGQSESWLAGGSVLWPILNYGTLSANLDKTNAEQQEALATYQKAILSALSDVERALTAYVEQEKLRENVKNEVEKDENARKVAQERYKAGETSRLEVLEADRLLLDAQNKLTQATSAAVQNQIAIYKSLGGGWKD